MRRSGRLFIGLLSAARRVILASLDVSLNFSHIEEAHSIHLRRSSESAAGCSEDGGWSIFEHFLHATALVVLSLYLAEALRLLSVYHIGTSVLIRSASILFGRRIGSLYNGRCSGQWEISHLESLNVPDETRLSRLVTRL